MSDKSPPKDLLDWLGITNTPNWRVARLLGITISALLALLIFGAFVAAFTLLGRTIQGGFDTAAGNLGAGALIVAILGAPFLVWSTVIKQTTVTFQKESHITDRISKAVEQLGAEKTVKKDGDESTEPNIEVRIGGLLSLERIAQDSTAYDNGRDHVRVMEIICAYVRENSNATNAEIPPFPEANTQDSIDQKLSSSTRDWVYRLSKPRSDIEFALLILGRRNADQIAIEANYIDPKGQPYSLDLSGTNLRKANLEGLNFENANFFEARMEGAYCKGANFEAANFNGARLTGISGRGLNLNRTRLEMADFSYASLDQAQLLDCEMSHTHFVRTQLLDARLRFPKKPIPGTMNRAFFIETQLRNARLEGDLGAIILTFKKYEHHKHPTGLLGIALRNAKTFDRFHIFGDENEINAFPNVDFQVMFGDATVEMPEGAIRPEHWPDWELPWDGDNAFETQWQKWLSDPKGYAPPPKPE